MRDDIRGAWVKRLRDPASKQARSTLFDGEGRCCLGHLVCVLRDEFPEAMAGLTYTEKDGIGSWNEGHGHSGSIPTEVIKSIDLTPAQHVAATSLNDVRLCSLRQIADWVEAEMPLNANADPIIEVAA